MDEQIRPRLVIMTDLSKLRHFSIAIFSETKLVTPNFFFIFGVSTLWPNFRREMKKISPQENFGANVLMHGTFLSTRTPSSRGETGSRPAYVTCLVCIKHATSVILRHC